MARRFYSSIAVRTTLSSGINSSVTSITVAAVTGFPSSYPYTLILDEGLSTQEVVEVTAGTDTTLTITRGVDGSTAVAHSTGAAVNHGVSARDFNEPNQFLNEGGTVTGASAITANTTTPALQITQTGTGNALVVEDSTSPDATPFVVNANGNVGVGITTPSFLLHAQSATNATAAVMGDSTTQLILRRSSDASIAPTVFFDKSRGTNAAPTTASSGDAISNIVFRSHDGTGYITAATISANIDSTPGTNDMPGRLVFSTTADGSATPTERMRITSTGNVGIGTNSPTSILDVNGLLTVEATTEVLNSGTITSNFFTADFATGAIFYITTAPAANFTVNVTNLPTTDNRVTVVSFFVIQGATGYIPNALQIDGTAQTIKWFNGVAPTATNGVGKVDNFSFTFIRRSAAWEVLGTFNRNF